MAKPICRICNSSDLREVLNFFQAPRNIERLLKENELDRDQPVKFQVAICNDCGHVQSVTVLEDDYYDEYLMSHSHAKKMQIFQRAQATEFISSFALEGKQLFEAGCGDGQFSLLLKELGCEVLANEPSSKARRACEDKGLLTLSGYVTRNGFDDLKETFDGFVARQVLEHVPEPNDFVKGMHNLLKPGGVGLIEVPSLEKALEDSRFFDFFPDHLSYFSILALTHLFTRNYFEIIQIRRVMDGEYNELWVRKIEHPNLQAVQVAADSISDNYREFLQKEDQAGHKVAIWGAGAKGVLALALVDVKGVAYLVDLDVVKQGLYTPVSHLQVSSPMRLSEEPVDTIIITALAYKDEITRDLREKYGFTGRVALLSGGDIVFEQ